MTRARVPYASAERALEQLEAFVERLAASGILVSAESEEFPGLRVLADSASIAWGFGTDGAASATVVSGVYQPIDDELSALAGLVSAADKGFYFTGAGTAATFDFSAFARTILDDANAGAVQTTLGLVIGTNVQAYDATLAALAGLPTAADKGIYATGSDTFGTFDLSSFGRTLGGSANAAAARTSLELGTAYAANVIAAHADSTAAVLADLVTDFNGLLAKMRTSGILAT